MNTVPEPRNDNKLLFTVAGLVAVGAIGIALLAGWSAEQEQTRSARNATPRPAPQRSVPARAPAMPASFERPVAFDAVEPAPAVEPESVPSAEQTFEFGPDENLVAGGLAAWEGRDFERAAAYFAAEIDARPERPWAQYMLGLSLWKDGRLDEAAVALERSAALDSSSIKTLVNLSRVNNDLADYEAALEAARAALQIDVDDPTALFLQGRSLMNLGRLEEAAESLTRSVQLDPDNGYAQNMLGLSYIRADRASEALDPLTRAAEIIPDVAYVHNNLGMAFERSGDPASAVASYRRAVECGVGNERATVNLARLEPTVPVDGVPPVEETLVADAAPSDPATELEDTLNVESESVVPDESAPSEEAVVADGRSGA